METTRYINPKNVTISSQTYRELFGAEKYDTSEFFAGRTFCPCCGNETLSEAPVCSTCWQKYEGKSVEVDG